MTEQRVFSLKDGNLAVVKITRRGGRRKCHCGCGKRVTHSLTADGCGMGQGCEWSMWKTLRHERPKGNG